MDEIYRYQRYIYDATRCFSLAGRDRLLRRLPVQSGDRLLEVGCGTARNLIQLARRHPTGRFYGLDASVQMLCTADENVRRAGFNRIITLRKGMAEHLDNRSMFALSDPFDTVFFSYSLTMIPDCVGALDAARRNLKPGGGLYIVDFWDQKGLPALCRRAIQAWLKVFHVEYKPAILDSLREWEQDERGRLSVESVGRRYAVIAAFETASYSS
jgi:S-adenosylmethionine-diacylgycerolhomoserine-N-methlytransferase